MFDWLRRRHLKRSLHRAAFLHSTEILDDGRYGAFAIYVVERLKQNGSPIRLHSLRGRRFDWVRFPVEGSVALKGRSESWPAIDWQKGQDNYGPFHNAPMWVGEAVGQLPNRNPTDGFVWDESAEELLKDARFTLSRVNRAAIGLEEWLAERQRRIPNIVGTMAKVLVVLLTAILSFLGGHFSK